MASRRCLADHVVIVGADRAVHLDLLGTRRPDELPQRPAAGPAEEQALVVRQLREKSDDLPQFIFVTAYEQHAVEAFRLEAMDYLLKPVDKARLASTIERARRNIQDRKAPEPAAAAKSPGATPRSKLMVRANNRYLIVDANDVIYATIDDGLITLVTTAFDGHSNYRTIEELQANLDREMFWRVHRSYLVNINRIKEVVPWFKSSYQLRMDDRKHTEVPVSRVQTRRLRELFKL